MKSVSVWKTTRRAQPALSRKKGSQSAESLDAATPFSVGTTLEATPTIIKLMKPTVIAWRVAPK